MLRRGFISSVHLRSNRRDLTVTNRINEINKSRWSKRIYEIYVDLWSFLGHICFYRRVLRDFAKVSKLLITLLCKDQDFFIDKEGECTFEMLKLALIESPILQSPNWDLPFEIMCDALDYAVGAVLGHRIENKPTAIWYVTCHFRASLKHKDDGQTKFIKPNSQRQDIIIKYWVSIGLIHREQGWL